MSNNDFGYDERLPENIREAAMLLCNDVVSLHDKWSFYLELYGTEENSVLLSDLARHSFQIIEESLRADLTMSICRLSDSLSQGNKNLSLRSLVQQCGTIDNMEKLLTEFLDACKPVRRLRNKRVAHNDLNTAIKPNGNPLPGIGRGQIDKILQLAGRILNLVYKHYHSELELKFTPFAIGGANDLIYWLKRGKDNKSPPWE